MSELAAANPTDRAQHLLRLTGRLTDLIETETGMFEARRPHEAMALQEEKAKLATIYRRETQLAAKDPARLAGLATDLKTALRAATERFEAAVEKNGAVVMALKSVTEGVVQAIAAEAARQKTEKSGYGPTATQNANLGAVALDQSV
ncbi:MAG: flagellar basal-body protein FlbY [Pseudomonadota bacterium]